MTRDEIQEFAAGNGLTYEDAVAVLSTMGITEDDEEYDDFSNEEHFSTETTSGGMGALLWVAVILAALFFLT